MWQNLAFSNLDKQTNVLISRGVFWSYNLKGLSEFNLSICYYFTIKILLVFHLSMYLWLIYLFTCCLLTFLWFDLYILIDWCQFPVTLFISYNYHLDVLIKAHGNTVANKAGGLNEWVWVMCFTAIFILFFGKAFVESMFLSLSFSFSSNSNIRNF